MQNNKDVKSFHISTNTTPLILKNILSILDIIFPIPILACDVVII